MKSWLTILAALLGLSVFNLGCAASGPHEILTDLDGSDAPDCRGASPCLKEGIDRAERGRLDEAEPYFFEACRRGSGQGCRRLADGYALGAFGTPRIEIATDLYHWACVEGEDPRACHALGELKRLGLSEGGNEEAIRYFERACSSGLIDGCHDRAVLLLVDDEPGDEEEAQALVRFRKACEQGLSAGCTNLAYMKAAGRGTGRSHAEARRLFDRECAARDSGWTPHPLRGLTEADGDEPEVFTSVEYEPTIACDQLEILVVGSFDVRVMAAFEAEKQSLQKCYEKSLEGRKLRAGRIHMAARISEEGDGLSPRIVEDELQIPAVRDCVETLLDRHLRDGDGHGGAYESEWIFSFLFAPRGEVEESPVDQAELDCDGEQIQRALMAVMPAVQRCGRRHLDEWGGRPGAVIARFSFGDSEVADDLAMTTTVQSGELTRCLESVLQTMEVAPGTATGCMVQAPFSFSGEGQLHFLVAAQPKR